MDIISKRGFVIQVALSLCRDGVEIDETNIQGQGRFADEKGRPLTVREALERAIPELEKAIEQQITNWKKAGISQPTKKKASELPESRNGEIDLSESIRKRNKVKSKK